MKNIFTTIFVSFITVSFYGQCMQDECHNVLTALPGCCSGTTVGASPGDYGDFDCLNLGGTTGNNDVWMYFEPAVADNGNYLQLDIDNITQDGITQWVVFRHESSSSCGSLNSNAQVIGNGCNTLAGDGVGGTTWTDTAAFPLQFGESYWIFLSIDEENGGTPGTFEVCISSVTPPPPTPGQDCITATPLCNENSSGFSIGNLQAGAGAVVENGYGCIGTEQNSQWYTFTVSETGTFAMNVDPVTMYSVVQCAGSGTLDCDGNGDDYDFLMLDITASAGSVCPTDAAGADTVVVGGLSVGCDYSGCQGSTGFGADYNALFGLLGSTQAATNDLCTEATQCVVIGPTGSCSTTPQWNATSPTLTAGNTYAVMIQNYSGSTGGVTVDFAGTAVIGPTSTTADFASGIVLFGCELTLSLTNAIVPNYTYTWDYGNGDSYTGSTPPVYNYTTPGTYFLTLSVVDSVGCTVSKQQQIDVAVCSPLPVEMISFTGTSNINTSSIDLKWVTASEANNDFFTIEKSINGTDFTPLAYVDANGNGNSVEITEYAFTDTKPQNGANHYKIYQTDFNGTKQWHKTITVNHKSVSVMEVAPNPSKGIFNLSYNINLRGAYSLNVYNLMGKEILTQQFDFNGSSSFNEAIDLTAYPKGIYLVTLTNGDVLQNKRIVIK